MNIATKLPVTRLVVVVLLVVVMLQSVHASDPGNGCDCWGDVSRAACEANGFYAGFSDPDYQYTNFDVSRYPAWCCRTAEIAANCPGLGVSSSSSGTGGETGSGTSGSTGSGGESGGLGLAAYALAVRADFNMDGIVSLPDLLDITDALGRRSSDDDFELRMDLNDDGEITSADVELLLSVSGETIEHSDDNPWDAHLSDTVDGDVACECFGMQSIEECTTRGYFMAGYSDPNYDTYDVHTYPVKCCTQEIMVGPCFGAGVPPAPRTVEEQVAISCGDGTCQSHETCGNCAQDCGRCQPVMNSWCTNNCYAYTECTTDSDLSCGDGWWSETQRVYWDSFCCRSTPPAGVDCGTCSGSSSSSSSSGPGGSGGDLTGTEFAVRSDLNSDGIIDGGDVLAFPYGAIGLSSSQNGFVAEGDIDRNGLIDEVDLNILLSVLGTVIEVTPGGTDIGRTSGGTVIDCSCIGTETIEQCEAAGMFPSGYTDPDVEVFDVFRYPIKCCLREEMVEPCRGLDARAIPPTDMPTTCGDGTCQNHEGCDSCAQDCGRCKPDFEAAFCDRNCYADTECRHDETNCGEGWFDPTTRTYWPQMCCRAALPPDTECGTCSGPLTRPAVVDSGSGDGLGGTGGTGGDHTARTDTDFSVGFHRALLEDFDVDSNGCLGAMDVKPILEALVNNADYNVAYDVNSDDVVDLEDLKLTGFAMTGFDVPLCSNDRLPSDRTFNESIMVEPCNSGLLDAGKFNFNSMFLYFLILEDQNYPLVLTDLMVDGVDAETILRYDSTLNLYGDGVVDDLDFQIMMQYATTGYDCSDSVEPIVEDTTVVGTIIDGLGCLFTADCGAFDTFECTAENVAARFAELSARIVSADLTEAELAQIEAEAQELNDCIRLLNPDGGAS